MSTLLRIVLTGCALMVNSVGWSGQPPGSIRSEVVRLSERAIVVRMLTPQATNVIALESDAGIIVIDTEVSPVLARAIRKTIEETFHRSDFAYVINTHHHGDHTYGNQVFADAVIVGMEDVPARMHAAEPDRERTIQQLSAALPGLRQALAAADPGTERAASLTKSVAYYEAVLSGLTDAFRLTPPVLTFNGRMTFNLGDLTLELVYFGPAHSGTDIVAFCPELNLVATGDLFAPGENPYIDSERWLHLDRWIEILDHMLSNPYAEATVVPGHGDVLTASDIRGVRDFVLAKKAKFAGKSSAFFAFRDAYEDRGLEAGLRELDALRARPDAYFLIHGEFDSYVYRLMADGKLDDAVPLFEKLASLFPDRPNAFDSLGEAYLRKGDREGALTAFERCIQMDPEHENVRKRLEELRNAD